jgi:CheY-like chemotaxis protein
MNLVVNARDAMPHGGPITISACAETVGAGHFIGLPEGRYVKLVVADEGQGMDEATATRATEPFFTTKGVGKGTGLGLSMVHGLAEQSSGRLVVKSKQGEGTQVEIWLPVAIISDVIAPESEAAVLEVKCLNTAPLDVMAIDDDALVLSTMCAQLEALGHRVTGAISAEQAIRHLHAGEHFDVVISDYSMPGTTGTQFAESARKLRPELPVIIATGYAELNVSFGLGIPRLKKPFSRQDLAAAIRDVVAL